MSRFILLDTGPLGQIARRRPDPSVVLWTRQLNAGGARLAIPDICLSRVAPAQLWNTIQ